MEKQIKIPTTRNGIATFNLIVETTIELFYEKGYFNTTIQDITSKAGIAAGTFYLYFPNKLLLYKHILNDFQRDIRKRIKERVANIEDRFEKEKEGIKTFINYAIENPHSYNIIWESLYIDKKLFMDYYSGFAKRYELGLKKSVEDGEMKDVDTELVSWILMSISTFFGLKIINELGTDHGSVDETVDKVMAILRTGIFK